MFEDHFEFSIGEDYLCSVYDYTPAEQNREHHHEDVRDGIEEYTYNWELVAKDSERRRGSDTLFLVDDEHYVWCSRTGMERAGNSVRFSASSPDELRFAVLSGLFESVSRRKFGEISEGIDKDDFTDDSLTVATPKGFILANELTQEELNEYFNEMAEIVVELIDRYNTEVDSCDALAELIDWYDDVTTELFREYAYDDFQPTTVSQVFPEYDFPDGWTGPPELGDNKSFAIAMYSDTEVRDDGVYQYLIEVVNDDTTRLVFEQGDEETELDSREYESTDELEAILDEFLSEYEFELDSSSN